MGSIFGAVFGAIAKAILGAIMERQRERDTFEAGATAAGLNASEAAVERARRAVRNRDLMRAASEDDLSKWLTNPEGQP